MLYENKTLGVSFEIADKITVRRHLAYKSVLAYGGERSDFFERLWNAAREIIEKWNCETISLDADLGEITDEKAVEIIQYVGTVVSNRMMGIENIPKN